MVSSCPRQGWLCPRVGFSTVLLKTSHSGEQQVLPRGAGTAAGRGVWPPALLFLLGPRGLLLDWLSSSGHF